MAPQAGDTLVFPETAANKVNNNNIGNRTFFLIQFTGGGYTLQGSELSVDFGVQVTSSGDSNTIDLDINLIDSALFAAANLSSLTFNGDIDLDSHMLSFANSGSITLNGVISGTGQLLKDGYGTLRLAGSASNTYSGQTRVLSGTLELAKTAIDGAINAGSLSIGNGSGGDDAAIVREAAGYQIGIVPITINEDGWLDLGNYTDTVGPITFNGGRASSSATGSIRLGGDVTVNASSEEAEFDGNLYIGAGTRTFSVDNGAAGYDLKGAAVFSGGNIVKTGAGTLGLLAVNTYTGTTEVNQGRLYITNGDALGDTASGTTVTGTGYIQLSSTDIGLEPLALDRPNSSGSALSASGASSWAGPVTLNVDAGISTGGTLEFSGVISGTGGISMNGYGTYIFSGSTANSYGGDTMVNDGTLLLNKTSGNSIRNGSLTIGDNAGSADTVMVRLQDDFQLWDTVPIIINADGYLDVDAYSDTVGAITFNGGHAGSSSGTLYLGGTVTVNYSTSQALFDGKLSVNASTRTFDVADGTQGYDLSITAVVSGGGMLKTGAGNMALFGANTYTGATTVNEGGIYVRNNSALGTTAGGTTATGTGFIYLVGNSVLGEPLTLDRPVASGTVLYASSTSLWTGDVVLDEDARISSSGSLELGGTITGSGGITFIGAGDLILSGSANNAFTGPTVVNDGQLLMDKNSPYWAVGYGSLTVGDGSGAADSAIARELGQFQLGSVPITVNADGLLDLNNFNDTVGNSLTLNGGGEVQTGTGTLTLGANSQILVDPVGSSRIYGNLNVGTGECTIDSAGLLYMYAAMSGTANITKTSSGYLYLMSANSFTGTMTVDQGVLSIRQPTSLGSEAEGTFVNNAARLTVGTQVGNEALTMDSSSYRAIFSSFPSGSNSWAGPITLLRETQIEVYDVYTLDISGPIDGAGSLVKTGEGELTLSGTGNNTFAGDVTVEEGTLLMGKTGQSIPHSLIIGGNGSGDPAAVARHLGSSEIFDHVTVNASGSYELNGYNEAIRDLNLNGGADVDTGSATLTIVDDVNVDSQGIVDAFSTISGNLALSGSTVLSVPPSTASAGNPSELVIDAVISGGGSISKTGGGELQLTAANTFTGPFLIEAGGLRLENDLGLGTAAGGTTVNGSAYLQIHGGGHTITGEHLTLNSSNSGYGGLYSTSGANAWTGDITLQSDSIITLGHVAATLDLSGSIGGAGNLTKANQGTLILSGAIANTYTGNTYVDAGTLALNKSVANGTIIGRLYIGDGNGGADADVVRLLSGAQIDTERVTVDSSGLFDLNNATEYIGSLAGSGHVDLGSGTLSTGADGTSTSFEGLIEGSGMLRKYGYGTFTLAGNNTYSGDTEIYSGTLRVNGSQSSSLVKVLGGGRLSGIGTVGAVESDGTVAPGASAGQLGAGSTVLGSGSTFELELDDFTLPGYDQLDVNGAIKLADADLDISWGFVPALGDSFLVIDNDGSDPIAGTFDGLPEGASLVAGNVTLRITYVGGTGNDVVLAATDVQPLEDLQITSISANPTNVLLEWEGGVPFFVVEKKESLTNATWTAVTTATRDFTGSVTPDTTNGFYRVTGGN